MLRTSRSFLRALPSGALSFVLAVALAVSLALHAFPSAEGLRGSHGPACVRALALHRNGAGARPEFWLDFEAPVVPLKQVGQACPPGSFRLEPPLGLDARWLSPQRVALVPRTPLPPFRAFGVRVGDAPEAPRTALNGLPLELPEHLTLVSSRLALMHEPRAALGRDGTARIELRFNARPAGRGPLDGATLRGADGTALRVRWTVDPLAEWIVDGGVSVSGELLDGVPSGEATLHLPAGLAPPGGGLGFERDEEHVLRWSANLRLVGVEQQTLGVRTRLTLSFSHHVLAQDFAGVVELSPRPPDLVLTHDDEDVVATGTFPPGARVRIKVGRGLQAAGGLALLQPVERVLLVPRPAPEVHVLSSGGALSTRARPEVEIGGVNLTAVQVTLRPVFASNLVPLALGWPQAEQAAAPGVVRRVPIDAPPDERFRRRLDLAELLGERPRGALWFSVADPEAPWRAESRLLQLSDLAPVARLRPEGLVVWVTRLSSGEPVEDVAVSAWSEANQCLGTGRTDTGGVCRLSGPLASEPVVVLVEGVGEIAWVDLSDHGLAHAAGDVEGLAPAAGVEAVVLLDRGIVRPGDSLHADVVLRSAEGDAPPVDLPVRLTLIGPDGRERRRVERRCGSHGLVPFDLPFALDAATGSYVLGASSVDGALRYGAASFRVQAVLPDRIEPRLSLPEGPLFLGDSVVLRLAARLLSGDAAAGLTARVRMQNVPAPVRVEQGFTFGDSEGAAPASDAELGSVTLDAAGEASLPVRLPLAGAAGGARQLTFTLEVLDVSGRAAFARLARTLSPAGPRVGVAPPHGAGFEVPVLAQGALAVPVTAVLERLEWRGGYVGVGERLRWRSERVVEELERVEVALEDGRGTARFAEAGDGTYRVRVLAAGAQGSAVTFERWSGVAVAGASTDGAPRLPLTLVGPAVTPGAPALITVTAPSAGSALLTVEGPGVFEAESVRLRAGAQTLEVPLPDVPVSNLHVTLTLVRPQRDAGARPVRLLGAVCVPLDHVERRLAVALDAPETALPEAPLTLTLCASAPCDVRVHVVDEGLLRLTTHPVPDPAGRFALRRRLTTRLFDAHSRLLDGARYADDPGTAGGDGESDGMLAARLDPTARRTVESLAWVSPVLQVDGTTQVLVPLPAFEGRVRVSVVAAGRRGTGAAAKDVIVRGPIGVAIHVPRAVSPGDVFDVPIDVRGEGVTSEVELQGLTLLAREPRLRVQAGSTPGQATVVVRAHDALGNALTRRAAMSLRPAAPLEVRQEARALSAAGVLEQTLPEDWLPATRRARLVVGGSPALELLPALERLLEYPHGCIEQTVSRAFPQLAWAELARLAAGEGGAPPDAVPTAIERVLSMQTGDGGLAPWPGGTRSYPFGSVYGAHFLVEARALGRAVPEVPLTALLDHLDDALRDGRLGAYAAYVLARAGRNPASALEVLADAHADARGGAGGGLEERAWLAAAFVLRGQRERATQLLSGPADVESVVRENGGSLASPLRATATLLTALLAAAPGDERVPLLAERLRDAAHDAARLTTQEGAAVLLALAGYEKVRARREGSSRGTLSVGARRLPFDGDRAAVLELGPDDPSTWRLEADGPATVIVRGQGVPRAPLPALASPGYAIQRRVEAPGSAGGPLRQGQVYTLVLSGRVPEGTSNVLLTDLLPGGLEIEEAHRPGGDLQPDRIEPRDDRVLFFRTAPLAGAFEVRYAVRAVTAGRFTWPPVALEALYAPGEGARSGPHEVLEVVR